jgi:hypothetical protein
MDTRFWGPSGWRLLHLIASDTLSQERKAAVCRWLELLEYVLPCKFCRASFHDYLRAQPLTDTVLETPASFGRWMYDIHNRVNAKLRGQGLLTEADPDWTTVRERYERLHAGLCKGTVESPTRLAGSPLLGWDFLTSVAYSTPAAGYTPNPMNDAPEDTATWATLDVPTRNRYNLLTRDERLRFLAEWWALFPAILPCAGWRRAWARAMKAAGAPPLRRGRDAMMRWMWAVEERVCDSLRCPTPHSCLTAMRREVAVFESGCGASKSRRAKTCRSLKQIRRDHVRTRRLRKRGVAVL